jgi:tripartite-type tricarboxylate transporter receptor subunit TctC
LKNFKLGSIFLASSILLAACGGGESTVAVNSSGASESKFPEKAIEIIVPYAAGGGTDTLARSFADLAKDNIGESVTVVNKAGGGGAIGMQNGLAAKPDGYTISMVTVELLTLPHSGLAQFTHEDFTPVALLNEDPAAITVKADAPWNTIEEFIEAAKRKIESREFWYRCYLAFGCCCF